MQLATLLLFAVRRVRAVRTFGFVTLPGCLKPELANLEQEHARAMTEMFGEGEPNSRQSVRMLRPAHSPTFAGLSEGCSAYPGGFGAIAEQLYGPGMCVTLACALRCVLLRGCMRTHSAVAVKRAG